MSVMAEMKRELEKNREKESSDTVFYQKKALFTDGNLYCIIQSKNAKLFASIYLQW